MREATECQLRFLPEPGCVHYVGLPFSMNDSLECSLARPLAIRRLYGLTQSRLLRRLLNRKECDLWHAAADIYLERSDLKHAWKAHLQSLKHPSGLKYVSFTRRLLGAGGRSRGPADSEPPQHSEHGVTRD